MTYEHANSVPSDGDSGTTPNETSDANSLAPNTANGTPEAAAENQQSQAYAAIRKGIVEFRYEPGQRLSAKQVREELGVGRTPVRESIVRLQQEGLVFTKPKSGSYVSLVNLENAENARFLRANAERAVAVECCSKRGDTDLQAIASYITEQEQAVQSHDQRTFFDADNAMHATLYRIANRERSWQWLESIGYDLDRFRWLHVKARGLAWESILEEHRALLGAIERREPEEAAYVIEHHLHVMLDEKDAVLEAFPQFFE